MRQNIPITDSPYFSPSHAKCLSQSFKLQITPVRRKGCRVSKHHGFCLGKKRLILFPSESLCLGKRGLSSFSVPAGSHHSELRTCQTWPLMDGESWRILAPTSCLKSNMEMAALCNLLEIKSIYELIKKLAKSFGYVSKQVRDMRRPKASFSRRWNNTG